MVETAIQEVFPSQNLQVRPEAPDPRGRTEVTTQSKTGILPSYEGVNHTLCAVWNNAAFSATQTRTRRNARSASSSLIECASDRLTAHHCHRFLCSFHYLGFLGERPVAAVVRPCLVGQRGRRLCDGRGRTGVDRPAHRRAVDDVDGRVDGHRGVCGLSRPDRLVRGRATGGTGIQADGAAPRRLNAVPRHRATHRHPGQLAQLR